MAAYENNDATRLIEDKFWEYNFEEEYLPGKEDIEAWNVVANFKEYVTNYAIKCGYEDDVTDTKKLTSFIAKKCVDCQADIIRQTIANWLNSGLPANTASARENVYKLCFALQLNANQTAEFFLKAYLERPFNYKNINEAVYFFCMNNELPYVEAIRIISVINSMPIIENPNADEVTEVIGANISEFKTENEFIKYISENRSGFTVNNKTAKECIKELIEKCMDIAPKEYAITNSHLKDIKVSHIDELLDIIYGYSISAIEGKKPVYNKTISDSNFPKLIKNNWPQKQQFHNIFNKETVSYDVIRRALIILSFYDFTANAIVEDALEEGIFDELVSEINIMLSKCGYVQLYWRNPFDWMIGYCAQSLNPLATFRDLIDEYYLSDAEVMEQGK